MHKRNYVEIDYTNWRGERGKRIVRVFGFGFGSTPYHEEPQWLFEAYNAEKQEERTFALAGLQAWRMVPAEELRKS